MRRAATLGVLAAALTSMLVGCTEDDASPTISQGPAATSSPSTTTAATTSPPTEAASPTPASPAPDASPATAPSTDASTPDRRTRVTPVVSRADVDPSTGDVEIAGYVDVVETGGRCTVTLSRDGQVATTAGEAEPDAATTVCGALVIRADELTEGTWSATLSYASATAVGESAAVTIEVRR